MLMLLHDVHYEYQVLARPCSGMRDVPRRAYDYTISFTISISAMKFSPLLYAAAHTSAATCARAMHKI